MDDNLLHDFSFQPQKKTKEENIDKNKNINQEELRARRAKSIKKSSFHMKEDTYAQDIRKRLKKRKKKIAGNNYGGVSRKEEKRKEKNRRVRAPRIKRANQKNNLRREKRVHSLQTVRKNYRHQKGSGNIPLEGNIKAAAPEMLFTKVKKKYNAMGMSGKVSLEDAKKHINLEYGLSGSKTAQALKANLYQKRGFYIGTGEKKRFVRTIGYRKLHTDTHMERYSGRRLAYDTRNVIKGYAKTGIKTGTKVGEEGGRALEKSYISSLRKEGGFAGETIADSCKAVNQAKEIVEGSGHIAEGAWKAGKNIAAAGAKGGRGARLVVRNTIRGSSLVIEKAKKGAEFYRANKGNRKQAFQQAAKQRMNRLRAEWNKKAIQEKLIQTAKKIKKKAIEFLKKINALFLKLVVGMAIPGILAITLIILIFTMVISLFGSFTAIHMPMEDYNSYRTVVDLCKAYSEEWKEYTEQQIPEDFNEPQPDCQYENQNKLEMEFTCPEGSEDETEPHFIIDPVQLYCLSVAVFDGKVSNLGVENGNEYDVDGGDAEEIKEYIRGVLEYYYPMSYMESERYLITQDLYLCDEELMDTQYDEEGNRIAWDVQDEDIRQYQKSFTKPDLYFPKEHQEGEGTDSSEKNHFYVETKMEIQFIVFTDVLAHLDLEDDVLENYTYFINMFVLHAKELDADPESEVKVPDWFWDTLIDFSVNDKLNEKELEELFNGAKPSDVTRKQFTDMVYSYCSPKGKIPYVWGGSSESGSDCSGFISLMLRKINAGVSGWSGYLWEQSVAIDASSAKPGDLVFKQSPSANGINHVGFYVGKGYEGGIYCHCASGSGTVCNNYKGFTYYRRLIIKFKDD